ncbi:BQ5605_C001g00094 [Microbotryum silenes-dioicae]|uniref:BQ5605_C001g00094 protein n=1 Tax=Microbotryum silenes-dioicae TaxID=796604 RepID=A0A2X0MWR4_9BASI|nr:BQ5605_C001g00094 [Microbotryum silenes-dioicae]
MPLDSHVSQRWTHSPRLAEPGRLAPKSLPEVPISQRQLKPLLKADFGERAMWVPNADDHMRTQTRPDAHCDMGDVE